MRLAGMPLELASYRAETLTNQQFRGFDLAGMDFFYLPTALAPLMDAPPVELKQFIEDDNRGAIWPEPVATLDGQPFYLSVKGVGSTLDPYSWRPLDRGYARELVTDPSLRARFGGPPSDGADRLITGELWLRGRPTAVRDSSTPRPPSESPRWPTLPRSEGSSSLPS
ncbi:MAG: hypothetical protein WCA77_00300 [Thermoplasmata archaeon]